MVCAKVGRFGLWSMDELGGTQYRICIRERKGVCVASARIILDEKRASRHLLVPILTSASSIAVHVTDVALASLRSSRRAQKMTLETLALSKLLYISRCQNSAIHILIKQRRTQTWSVCMQLEVF